MSRRRPNLGSLFNNFRAYDAPIPNKMYLAVRNASKRFRGQTCCGHHGQPGC